MNVSPQTLLVLVLFILLADVLGGLIVGAGVLIVRKLLALTTANGANPFARHVPAPSRTRLKDY
jgi:hypothetical protein